MTSHSPITELTEEAHLELGEHQVRIADTVYRIESYILDANSDLGSIIVSHRGKWFSLRLKVPLSIVVCFKSELEENLH